MPPAQAKFATVAKTTRPKAVPPSPPADARPEPAPRPKLPIEAAWDWMQSLGKAPIEGEDLSQRFAHSVDRLLRYAVSRVTRARELTNRCEGMQ